MDAAVRRTAVMCVAIQRCELGMVVVFILAWS